MRLPIHDYEYHSTRDQSYTIITKVVVQPEGGLHSALNSRLTVPK